MTAHETLLHNYPIWPTQKHLLPEAGERWRERCNVTICIAATCNRSREGGPKIILCTDWRVSTQLSSADIMHKQAWLPGEFVCLTAGDPHEALAVVGMMRRKFFAAKDVNETNVVQLVKDTLYERRAERRNALAQSRFGLSHDDVIRRGKEMLPAEHFIRYLNDAASIRLDSEFIVAGFSNGDDLIVETRKNCEAKLVEDFSCVGEGEYLAQASLLHREFETVMEFNRALYYVYEAKKSAQRVNSVGDETLITILGEDKTHIRINHSKYPLFNALYKRFGPQDVPRNLDIPADVFEERGVKKE